MSENLRRVVPIKVSQTINPIVDAYPEVLYASPFDLFVDETYQRNLSERSMKLIRTLITDWSWRKFKMPNVVRTDDGRLHVVDGQHTAIAAASRDDIDKIPVMVIQAETIRDRATAFVGINRDRISVTPYQIFKAEIAAENVDAIGLSNIATEYGVTFLAQPKYNYEIGDTLALSSFKKMYRRMTTTQMRMVLEVCRDAKLAPIGATELKAIETLLWTDNVSPHLLVTLLRSLPQNEWEAKVKATSARKKISTLVAALEVYRYELKRLTGSS